MAQPADFSTPNCMDSTLSDAQLVARVLTGEQDAYRLLVERHYRAVYGAAYRLLGNQAEAADIVQEAFLRAYNALATFRRDAPLAPWLCRIAINLSYNSLKKQHPTFSLEALGADNANSDEEAFEIPDTSAEPQQTLLQKENRQLLHRAILSLSPDQRRIIELRHFQELSYDEIGASLGLSLANVKVRLFRARKKLQSLLSDAGMPG